VASNSASYSRCPKFESEPGDIFNVRKSKEDVALVAVTRKQLEINVNRGFFSEILNQFKET
jgi:hypothetical protein